MFHFNNNIFKDEIDKRQVFYLKFPENDIATQKSDNSFIITSAGHFDAMVFMESFHETYNSPDGYKNSYAIVENDSIYGKYLELAYYDQQNQRWEGIALNISDETKDFFDDNREKVLKIEVPNEFYPALKLTFK